MSKTDNIIVVLCVFLLLVSIIFFPTIVDKEKDEDKKEDIKDEEVSLISSTRSLLSSGKNSMITAEALYYNLNDNYAGNDPYILSIRSADDYAKGHIPGAVNIPFRSVFTEENISKIPTNKQIVVYCYTGHTASQITALLNLDGYNAVCLKWGIASWTYNTTIASSYYDAEKSAFDYPVVTGSQPGSWSDGKTVSYYQYQDIRCGVDDTPVDTGVTDESVKSEEIDIRAEVDHYLASGKPPAITADSLYTLLDDGVSSNDPFILSIRSASQYAIGHIPGAVNIAFTSLFTDENLSKLPDDDRSIVVVCYTGHTASQATALLNVNGYNATALKWSMIAWTKNSTVSPSAYDRTKDCHNYPVVIGNESGGLADGVVAGVEQMVLDGSNNYLKSGKGWLITAEALYANLNDHYTGNDPFILSIRSADDYALGHIPGAVNIPFRSVFTEENISKLPTNKQIVVYCYTGHTASQVTAMLNTLGFDAFSLKWGISSWTFNTTIAGSYYNPEFVTDYPVVLGTKPGTWSATRSRQCDVPSEPVEGSDTNILGSGFDIIRSSADSYLKMGKAAAMSADSLYGLLNDGNTANDPFILSIRSVTQYPLGHIAGAVNIGFANMFDKENIVRLPKDKQIVVVCYTGHTASQATAILNMNGYDAIALKWGMTGWSTNTTIAPSGYNRDVDCHNYPVEIGIEPGSLDTAEIVGFNRIIQQSTRSYAASGKSWIITADALYSLINDNYAGNDPFILSIRNEPDYASGHIPGAVNIPFRSVFTEENISKLPMDKDIVVYCYTGHTASQITGLLNTLGFDALSLKWGIASWTSNTTIAGSYYNPATLTDYPVVSGTEPGSWSVTRSRSRDNGCGDETNGGGTTTDIGGETDFDVLSAATNNYLALGKSPAISGEALYGILNDGNTSNDPFILSIRSAAQYEIGHIAGAVNIGFSTLFDNENLKKLPTDRQIVVICYTGHTASQATSLLNINGFDAIALKFGMTGWTTDPIAAPSAYNRLTNTFNYPVVIGNQSGSIDDAIIADTGKVVLESTRSFMNAGKSTMITAEALHANLNDNYASNDPFILSIRKSVDYAVGHIPGAVNIPFGSVFTKENLSLLPMDKDIIVYCYTGHTASQVTAMLNVLGYDAMCLKWGIASWTTNTTVAGSYYDPATVTDLPVATGSEPGTWPSSRSMSRASSCEDPTNGGGGAISSLSTSTYEIAQAAANNYLALGKSPAISASALNDILADGNTNNDPFILSIRSSAQYAIGHIPGAVNIGFTGLFEQVNLSLLPTDRQIVVVCYTGHTASQATALLNMNGYDAIALKFGMTGWTTNSTVAPSAYNRGSDCHKYPVVIGVDPGTIATAILVSPTDEEVLAEAALTYLEGGPKYINASSLQAKMSDANPSNDPFILSIRSSTDYNAGHIPTAVNIPWRSLFSLENLSKLPDNDTSVVVVCYTGQSASQVTALLNVLGFNASTLLHGMCSWNTTAASKCFDNATQQMNYSTCNGTDSGSMATASRSINSRGCEDPGTGSGGLYTGSADDWEMLRQTCERYANDVVSMTITATAVYNNLVDNYTANDPYVISLRSVEHYEIGHIPGAINIPSADIFSEATLAQLPMDKQIVVYCYTGHTAGHVTALLNINGFDAVSLKFGMCSWSINTTINAGKCYNPSSCGDFQIYVGTDPGAWL